MASTFPAAIANEPPPLDVSSEDEDSEEFRSHGLKLDVPSGEPTPVSTPFKRPLNKSPEKVRNDDLTDLNEDLVSSTSPESRSSSTEDESGENRATKDSHDAKVNGIYDPKDNTVENRRLEDVTESSPSSNEILKQDTKDEEPANCDNSTTIHCTNSSSSQPLQVNINAAELKPDNEFEEKLCDDLNDEFPNETSESTEHSNSKDEESSISFQGGLDQHASLIKHEENDSDKVETSSSILPQISVDVDKKENVMGSTVEETDANNVTEEDLDDDFDDDFGAFQSIPQPLVQAKEPEPVVESNVVEDDDDDDDFGDFAQNSVQPPPIEFSFAAPKQMVAQSSQESFENFADFQDCSFQNSEVSTLAKPATDVRLLANKIDTIIKSLFVLDPSCADDEVNTLRSIDSEIRETNDSTWARVQDFEGSHALMFKWMGSLSGRRLLRSLNINTSNIVYHEKWGTIEVPRFAASLVQTPLQPQSCNKLESQTKLEERPTIVNNNTIISDEHDKPATLSAEAQEILRQLPDLSYMRANTLVFPSPSEL